MSRVYEPHTTEDVLALAEAAISTFPDIGDQGDFTAFFNGGHCLSFAPRQEHRQAIFGTKDNIWPRINIRAMYDGKAFRASCGYFRDACRNMAEIKSVRSTNVTIRHDGGLRDKMDDLVKQFRSLSTGWSNLKDWALTQEDNQVNLRDFIHDLYGEPDADASERTRSGLSQSGDGYPGAYPTGAGSHRPPQPVIVGPRLGLLGLGSLERHPGLEPVVAFQERQRERRAACLPGEPGALCAAGC